MTSPQAAPKVKKDKAKVLDEVLSEERIKTFLDWEAPEGENSDFHCLEKAYRGMPPKYFKVFLKLFIEQKRNINAPSKNGQTLLASMQNHKQSKEYIELLKLSGAE